MTAATITDQAASELTMNAQVPRRASLAPPLIGQVCSLNFLGRGLNYRCEVGLANDGHHLLFHESTLSHRLLAVEEPYLPESLVRRIRAGHWASANPAELSCFQSAVTNDHA
jgi:hypothetical protein